MESFKQRASHTIASTTRFTNGSLSLNCRMICQKRIVQLGPIHDSFSIHMNSLCVRDHHVFYSSWINEYDLASWCQQIIKGIWNGSKQYCSFVSCKPKVSSSWSIAYGSNLRYDITQKNTDQLPYNTLHRASILLNFFSF